MHPRQLDRQRACNAAVSPGRWAVGVKARRTGAVARRSRGSSEHPQYPVVLVTGACRSRRLPDRTAAQNPLINRVIAVDAIAERGHAAPDGPSRTCADIRKPIHRQGDRTARWTVVHAAVALPRSGSSAALKELNVMGAMQPVRRLPKGALGPPLKSQTSEVYVDRAQPVMFTEDSAAVDVLSAKVS